MQVYLLQRDRLQDRGGHFTRFVGRLHPFVSESWTELKPIEVSCESPSAKVRPTEVVVNVDVEPSRRRKEKEDENSRGTGLQKVFVTSYSLNTYWTFEADKV